MARQAQTQAFSRTRRAAYNWNSRADPPEKCRERRRRRIQIRRSRSHYDHLVISSPETTFSDSVYINRKPHYFAKKGHDQSGRTTKVVEEFSPPPPSPPPPPPCLSQNPMPLFNTISIKGVTTERMEYYDSLCVHEDFCRLEIMGGEPLHFFAVYNGHLGPHAAALYKELMHRFMVEELTGVATTGESATTVDVTIGGGGGGESQENSAVQSEQWLKLDNRLRTALRRSFERMGRVAFGACWCIDNDYPCACKPIRLAFEGSAAVVAILMAHHIVVARCGVSRAVLCRGGVPIPLSASHDDKPEGTTELERVYEVGGQADPYPDGVQVYEMLDVSRPLEPEISITERGVEDECLILASNAVWDVMSEDTACKLANICLRDGKDGDFNKFGKPIILFDQGHQSDLDHKLQLIQSCKASVNAATLLCRLALGRGSSETISVIVVDLKRHQ